MVPRAVAAATLIVVVVGGGLAWRATHRASVAASDGIGLKADSPDATNVPALVPAAVPVPVLRAEPVRPAERRSRDQLTAPIPALAGPQPLAPRELLAKAGEKDGDTTYTRLLEEAYDMVPRLTVSERDDLRAVARKRQAQLKVRLAEDAPAGPEDGRDSIDELSSFERRLLGEERYRLYLAALSDALRQ